MCWIVNCTLHQVYNGGFKTEQNTFLLLNGERRAFVLYQLVALLSIKDVPASSKYQKAKIGRKEVGGRGYTLRRYYKI